MRSVDEVADELYSLPPAAFTAARDEAAATARAAGDTAGARRLAALKRPTQGAHLVNLLALRRPEAVAGLIELGEAIRAAQGSASSNQVRELSAQRQAALATAVKSCQALAAEVGAGQPTAAQLDEARSTLAAAMADTEAAQQVSAGRVVKALTYAGFGGGFGATAAKASVGTAPRAVPTKEPAPARAGWERLARAEAQLAQAKERESAANEELDRLADEITRLRAALDTATTRARAARGARQAAERALALARREVSTQEREA